MSTPVCVTNAAGATTNLPMDPTVSILFAGRVPHQEVERYYALVDVLCYPRKAMRLTELVTPLKPLAVPAAIGTGALVAFLIYNWKPALIYMGDTGSLSLGATLAVVALMTGQWPLLLLIGVIPLSEALSVTLQIGYFKMTKGKRLFKMAPLHLHFELLGWSETQVVQRFWLIGLLAAMLGIGLTMV